MLTTDGTLQEIVAASFAILAAKVNNLKMQFVPGFFREKSFEVFFSLLYRFAVG